MMRFIKPPTVLLFTVPAVVMILTVGVSIGAFWSDRWMQGAPWFEASVSIPDHHAGSDPTVIYRRVIRRPLEGSWTVEAQKRAASGWDNRCDGGGVNGYQPDEASTRKMKMSAFMGRDSSPCDLTPGTWRLMTTWSMAPIDGSQETRHFRVFSNTFHINQ